MGKHFLFFRNGALGDTLALAPTLLNIKQKFPDAKIAFAGNTEVAQFLKTFNVIDEYIPAHLLLFLSISDKSKFIETLSKFDKIILYTAQFADITKGIKGVYNFPPLPAKNDENVYNYILSAVKSCGIEIDDNISPITVFPQNIHLRENIDILLHPRYDERSWGINNFLCLLEKFIQEGYGVKIIFGPQEKKIYNSLKERYEHFLIQSDDLLSAVSYVLSAKCVISDDSGFAHLSANLGKKTYIIFGPTSSTRWAPPMRNVKVIRKTGLICAPCENNYKDCAEKICLSSITIQEIFNNISLS